MLWIVIGAKGKWWAKLTAIIIVPLFSFMMWNALLSFTGWPADTAIPDRMMLTGSIIVEPTQDNPGSIYIWGISPVEHDGFLDYKAEENEPRAYKVPYTRELHKQIQRARELQQSGERVEIRSRNKKGKKLARGRYVAYPLPSPVSPLKP